MWVETKHGLYKQFVFSDFHHAWAFMQRVSTIMNQLEQYPRLQSTWNVVEIWIVPKNSEQQVTQEEQGLAAAIDAVIDAKSEKNLANGVEKNTTKITEVQLYADGGSRGNPGPSACGFVVLNMDGRVLLRKGKYIGITTNNQAEYQALKLGLEEILHTFQSRSVHVYMDSLLVVNQMKRIFKIRNRDLWPVHDAIQQMLLQFEKVSFDHIPRELNKLADAEVNKALDNEQGSPAEHVG
ncbi:MAG: reverse transcriptase-like protein [Candidatus Saccharimonadales bacterium]